jgi:hypothetical protein
MLCGEEMRLVQSVPDETMIVAGFEHHTFHCAACHDEERRLVFVREPKALSPPIQTESAPIQTEGMDQDFVDATLQPVGEPAAADRALQESRTVKSEEVLPAHRLPLALPAREHYVTALWVRRLVCPRKSEGASSILNTIPPSAPRLFGSGKAVIART